MLLATMAFAANTWPTKYADFKMEMDDAMKEKFEKYFSTWHKSTVRNPGWNYNYTAVNFPDIYKTITGEALNSPGSLYPPLIWEWCENPDNFCELSRYEGELLVRIMFYMDSAITGDEKGEFKFFKMVPRHLKCKTEHQFVVDGRGGQSEARVKMTSNLWWSTSTLYHKFQFDMLNTVIKGKNEAWKYPYKEVAVDFMHSCELRAMLIHNMEWAGDQETEKRMMSYQFSDYLQHGLNKVPAIKANDSQANKTILWVGSMPDGIRTAIMRCADDCDANDPKATGCKKQDGKKWPCPFYTWHKRQEQPKISPYSGQAHIGMFPTVTYQHLFNLRHHVIEWTYQHDHQNYDKMLFIDDDLSEQRSFGYGALYALTGAQLIERITRIMSVKDAAKRENVCTYFRHWGGYDAPAVDGTGCVKDDADAAKQGDLCTRLDKLDADGWKVDDKLDASS